jgi:hypothetical protein
MPHSKCVPCRTRLYSAAAVPDLVGDLCPDCGGLLEPVLSAAEVVGFRQITIRRGSDHDLPIAQAVALPRPEGR